MMKEYWYTIFVVPRTHLPIYIVLLGSYFQFSPSHSVNLLNYGSGMVQHNILR